MKKIIAFLASAFLLPSLLMAQAPQAMTYQAIARDGNGNPLGNQTVSVEITIHDVSSGGAIVYQETQSSVTTNQFGLFTLQIGNGTSVSGTFKNINWSSNPKFIQVGFDPNNGTNYLDMGTTQLLSVPYALYSATAGKATDSLILNGNELSVSGGNTVTLPSGSSGGDNWGTQTVVSNSTLTGNGTLASPLGIAPQGATTGQVLKWNGTFWQPEADNNTTYTAGSGISISGTTITNTSPNQQVAITGSGATTVTGAYPTFNVSSTDAQQLGLSGSTLSITGGNSVTLPTGTTYTAGSGVTINGSDVIANNAQTDATLGGNGTTTTPLKIAQQSATSGQTLKWNGTTWLPATDNDSQTLTLSGSTLTISNGNSVTLATGTTYTAGSGVTINGSDVIANNAQTDATLGGNGTTTTPLKLAQQSATSGQTLKWNGTTWLPANDNDSQTLTLSGTSLSISNGNSVTLPTGTTYTAGAGITITGNSIANSEPNQSVAITGGNSNTVIGGAYPNFTVTSTSVPDNATITGSGTSARPLKIAQQGATANQVLEWNGSAWAPATVAAGTIYTAGAGITISGNTISNSEPGQSVIITGGNSNTVIGGGYPNYTVTATSVADNTTITGSGTNASPLKIAQQGAVSNQVLEWNGSSWAPATLATVSLTGAGGTTVTGSYPNFTVSSTAPSAYTPGPGISIVGTTISNTEPGEQVSITGTGGTNVTGTYPNFTVNSTVPTTYTAGSGIALAGSVFSNNAVTDATLAGSGITTAPLKIAQQGASTGQVLEWNGTTWAPASAGASASAWSLTGNSGTAPGTNFVGTTDTSSLVFKTNSTEKMRISSIGNVGIGTVSPGYPLHVIGNQSAGSAIGVVSNNNAAGVGLSGQNIAATGTSTGIGLFGATQQSGGYGVLGENLSSGGTGIVGVGNDVTAYTLPTAGAGGAFYGNGVGAYGFTNSNGGDGVYGKSTNATSAYGVAGVANGVQGAGPASGSGGAFTGYGYGVSGIATDQNLGVGGDQSAGGYFALAYDGTTGTAYSTTLVEAASITGTHYKIWGSPAGAVSTTVPDLNGKQVTLHAPETPEFYFQDYGQGKLVNGKVHITIDPILAKNVAISDKHPLRVFVQLEGDCKGVYVTNKTATGFDVVELGGGTSNVDFQWSITCNVADAKVGKMVSPFADLRFEDGPISQLKNLKEAQKAIDNKPIQAITK